MILTVTTSSLTHPLRVGRMAHPRTTSSHPQSICSGAFRMQTFLIRGLVEPSSAVLASW